MKSCKHVGVKKLSELTEKFDINHYEIITINDLQIFILGTHKTVNKKEIFNISLFAVEKSEDDNPDMDCFKVNLNEDANEVYLDVNRITKKVINIRQQGSQVEDIIDFWFLGKIEDTHFIFSNPKL